MNGAAGRAYVLGIDVGTSGVRAGVFDAAGRSAGLSSVPLHTRHPHQGWAEQDAEDWWRAACDAVPRALHEAGIGAADIAGISVDAMSSTVLAVNRDGVPLRPAILWMDVRSAEQAERIANTGEPALKYNGHSSVSAEWGLPKAMWLRDHEPDVFAASHHVLDCVDWMTWRLTGVWTQSVNTASSKYYFDRDDGGWPEQLYKAAGADDVLDRLVIDVYDVGEPVGDGLTAEAGRALGLRAGIPVAEGSVDAYAGALGLGVVTPGAVALITGSSHCIIAQSSEAVHDPGFWGAYTDAMIRGLYTIEAGQASTGSIVAWLEENLAGGLVEKARRLQVPVLTLLGQMAAEVPVGSDGLLVLDYFQGNRSPHTDPRARGAISGLSLTHGLGHLFRAVMEAVCYGTEEILETMRGHGFAPTVIAASGGPARSELWMQMHADVSGVPIALPTVGEGPVLGAAIQASVGAGLYPDLATAAQAMVHRRRTLEPDAGRHAEYAYWFARYRELYGNLRELQHNVVSHGESAGVGEIASELSSRE